MIYIRILLPLSKVGRIFLIHLSRPSYYQSVKPKVFIGSSSESIPLLNVVNDCLASVSDTMTWTDENAFALNQGTLDSLLKQAKLSDFAILIATKDDVVALPARGLSKQIARDNIIFEFGLFLGALSLHRAFLLAEEGIDLPTDLNGVTVLNFSTNVVRYNSIHKRCQQIVDRINTVSGRGELGFVPSTALAIGYFTSYVKRLCEALESTKQVIYNDEYVGVKTFQLNVILPEDIDEGGIDDFANRFKLAKNLEPASTVEQDPLRRSSSFRFKIEPQKKDDRGQIDVLIYDIPSTINTIWETIKIYYPSSQIGKNTDREHLEKRELKNFANVLRYYVEKNSWTKDHVVILEDTVL